MAQWKQVHRGFGPGFALVVMLMASGGCAVPAVGAPREGSAEARQEIAAKFVNPIVVPGADPWVFEHDGWYYMCQSEDDLGVSVRRSRDLTQWSEERVVWRAPENPGTPAARMYSKQTWAPELHRIGERWYIYVAASDGKNKNHLMYALRSVADDPYSEYEVLGPMYTGDEIATGENNRWAIDGTPFEYNGQLYFTWSGWQDDKDEQFLYIAKMSNPWTISSNRVKLCANDDYLWERVDEKLEGRGLHEAPQMLERDGRLMMVYSCSGSWQASYKLGMLELKRGGDPMKAADWMKHPEPVFARSEATFGTGHCSFVKSPDGREDWMLYHAKTQLKHGWADRVIHVQKFRWTEDGLPDFGRPIDAGVPMAAPSGQGAGAGVGSR